MTYLQRNSNRQRIRLLFNSQAVTMRQLTEASPFSARCAWYLRGRTSNFPALLIQAHGKQKSWCCFQSCTGQHLCSHYLVVLARITWTHPVSSSCWEDVDSSDYRPDNYSSQHRVLESYLLFASGNLQDIQTNLDRLSRCGSIKMRNSTVYDVNLESHLAHNCQLLKLRHKLGWFFYYTCVSKWEQFKCYSLASGIP